MNVTPGQPVELRVAKRLNESYQPSSSRGTAAFGGSGHRLGAPVPEATTSSEITQMPGSFDSPMAGPSDSASTSGGGAGATRFAVDPDLPQTSVQIRLADGTR